MFARRNFVYKLAAHRRVISARDSSDDDGDDDSPASSYVKALESITPVSSVAATSTQSSTTSSSSSSSSTSSSSTSTTSTSSLTSTSTSPSSLASTSTSTRSSTPPSSSTIPASSSAALSSLIVPSATTSHVLSVTSQVVSGKSLTPTSTLTPSASSTSSTSSSSGTNTGAIIGGIAGTLAGIAVLGFLLMWCMRRQRERDVDDFDAQAFKRQSAILVDDPVEPPHSYNPRPPTMIERHNASPGLAAQTGFGGQNFYGSYGGFGQQPAYSSEMAQPSDPLPQQAYAAPPMGYSGYDAPPQQIARQPSSVGYADYDSQQQLARQPSNAGYLTRQPSSPAGYTPPTAPPSSFDPNAHYIDLNRSSVSPYQAVQYADISRQLGSSNPNGQVPHESDELPDEPLPSPFDDPAEATRVPNATPQVHPYSDAVAPGPVSTTHAPQPQGNVPALHQRPGTVYEEGDAYGGI